MRPNISRKVLTTAAATGILSLTGGIGLAMNSVAATGDPSTTGTGQHAQVPLPGNVCGHHAGLGGELSAAVDDICRQAVESAVRGGGHDDPDGYGDDEGGHPKPKPTDHPGCEEGGYGHGCETDHPTPTPTPTETTPTPTPTETTPTPTPTETTPTPTPTCEEDEHGHGCETTTPTPTPTETTTTPTPTPTETTPTPTPTETTTTPTPTTTTTPPCEEDEHGHGCETTTPTPTETATTPPCEEGEHGYGCETDHPHLPDTGSDSAALMGAAAISAALVIGGTVMYLRGGRLVSGGRGRRH